MATRKEYQLAVTNAGINVRGKQQTLNEAQQTLSEAQEILANLQSRSTDIQNAKLAELRTRSLLNAQVAVQNAQNAVTAAGSELRQAKTDLTSAQLELNNPDQVFDPEPVRASDAVTLTQEQRNRLDQINADRLEKDLLPLTPGDPAALAAVNASFAAEQTTQAASNRATASSQTAGDAVANTQGSVVPTLTIKEQALQNWNAVLAEGNKPPVGMDDPGFLASYERAIAANPSLGVDSPSVEPGRNTGTSTGDFIEADALSSAEAAKVQRQVDPTDTGGANEFGGAPTPKEGWTNDGKGVVVNMSGTNSSTKTPTTVIGGSAPMVVKSVDNPLHAYPDYTYSLSLHVLSPASYKKLVDSPSTPFKPTVTLVSSANKYSKSPPRDQAFTDDFYFDGLKMTTVIGLGNSSRGTNVNDLSFNLIEPYGMTLLNRLLDMNIRLGHKNYLDVPYLLEINFFGYDDKGASAKLENHSKYIPIRLVTMKIKAGTKGSEYAFTAIPYNKIAHLQSMQTLKSNFEITAKTVGDFFSSKGSDYAATAASINIAAAADKAAAQAAKDSTRVPAGATASATPPPKVAAAKTITSSFTQAFNLWNEQSKKHGAADVADIVEFNIDPEISAATIVEPLTANPSRSAIQTAAGTTTSGSQTNRPQGTAQNTGADFTTKNSVINAGTSITKIINDVLINSSFIRSQLVDSETASTVQPDKKNTPADANSLLKAAGSGSVKWFKITNKIELLAYDDKRGGYGKKIIFFINKYDHYQSSFPGAPKGQPTGAVKNYNYMYTGENRDIIDFEIKFDSLFVNVIAMDKNKIMATNTNPWAGSPNKIQTKRSILPAYTLQPTQIVNTSGTQESLTGGSDETSAKQQAANFAENIYSSAGGDMVELKMKIIGDPHFIKQDEVLFSPDKTMNSKGQWVDKEGGSLSMDKGEIYCNITFKSPVDIDESTGLLRQGSKWKDVYFSGLYKINTVESEFKQGKFLQTINGFRIKDQKGDARGPQTSSAGAAARSEPSSVPGASNSAVPGQATVAGDPAQSSDGAGGTRGVEPNTVTQIANLSNGESDTIITDNVNGKQYRRTADGATEEISPGQAPDRPGPDPLQQAARDNASTVEEYEGARMSSGPDFPLPDESSADPNQALLRNVAQNGPTATIEQNSDDSGAPIVGAPSATTQAVAPATQTPPVQTPPSPAPATAAQRQETAATAASSSQVSAAADLAIRNAADLQRARAVVDSVLAEQQAALDALTALNAKFDALSSYARTPEEARDRINQRASAAARLERATMAFDDAVDEVRQIQSAQEVKNNTF